MRAFPSSDELVADSQVHKQLIKHTIAKSDESTCEVRTPAFIKGSLEHFLKFLIAFKHATKDTNIENKTRDVCREFHTHTQGRALNRFNAKHEEIMVNLPDDGNLTSTNFKEILSFVITGFGRTNRLKCIKLHMMTIGKSYASTQDDFLERMHVMQRCLGLLHTYVPSITALKDEHLKDACVQAQPVKF